MTKQKFVYVAPSNDVVKKHSTKQGSLYDSIVKSGFSKYKVKPRNRIRICPRPPTPEGKGQHWALDLFLRYGIGPNNARYLDNKRMGKSNTSYLETQELALRRAGNDKAANAIKVGRGALCWVIDRDNEAEGPQWWLMPAQKVEQTVCALSVDPDTNEVINVENPDAGYDITFETSGTGTNVQYNAIAISRRSTPLSDNQKNYDAWLDYILENPLESIIQFYDDEHIKAIYDGGATEDAQDDVVDQEVATRPRKAVNETAQTETVRPKETASTKESEATVAPTKVVEPTKEVAEAPRRRVPVATNDDDGDVPPPRRRVA